MESIFLFFKNIHVRSCVTFFIGKEHDILLQILQKFHQKNLLSPLQVINVVEVSFQQFLKEVSFSLFGQSLYYCLYGINELKETIKNNWILFFKQYQGPHFFYILHDEAIIVLESVTIYQVPEVIAEHDFFLLSDIVGIKQNKELIARFIQCIGKQQTAISFRLGFFCVLYMQVMPFALMADFCNYYMPHLEQNKHSFFELTEAFFAKNKNFFLIWHTMFLHYSVQFWIVFWSEQIFRAAFYIYYRQKNAQDYAKKISFKLPFSFMKKDWKHHSLVKLQLLHKNLYLLDNNIKNGISSENINTVLHLYFFDLALSG